jgi:hypothetical protein
VVELGIHRPLLLSLAQVRSVLLQDLVVEAKVFVHEALSAFVQLLLVVCEVGLVLSIQPQDRYLAVDLYYHLPKFLWVRQHQHQPVDAQIFLSCFLTFQTVELEIQKLHSVLV